MGEPDSVTLKYLFSSLVVPSGSDKGGVPILTVHPINLPDPLQLSYEPLLREFNGGIRAYLRDGLHLVWLAQEPKYRPALHLVEQFLTGLDPGLPAALKSFIIVGSGDGAWLEMVGSWLGKLPSNPLGLGGWPTPERVASLEELRVMWGGLLEGYQSAQVCPIQPRLFGEDLESLDSIQPILDLMGWLQSNGPACQGIFRLSADSTALEWHRSVLNARQHLDFDAARTDPHEMAGLLKMFFRDLPSPLIPRKAYPALVQLPWPNDPLVMPQDVKMKLIEVLRQAMSERAWVVLGRLVQVLAAVAEQEETSRMGPRNLAICWAPNLIHDEACQDQFGLLKASLGTLEILIRNVHLILKY